MATKDISRLKDDLSAMFDDIVADLPDIVQAAGLDAIAKVKNRVQQQGLSASETAFPDYSPQYKRRKAARYGEESVARRNLTLTGNMWREVQIVDTINDADAVAVVIDGRTSDAQKKIQYNSEDLSGGILRLSESEQQEISDDTFNEINERIRNHPLFK